jgi:hypothetical protein
MGLVKKISPVKPGFSKPGFGSRVLNPPAQEAPATAYPPKLLAPPPVEDPSEASRWRSSRDRLPTRATCATAHQRSSQGPHVRNPHRALAIWDPTVASRSCTVLLPPTLSSSSLLPHPCTDLRRPRCHLPPPPLRCSPSLYNIARHKQDL